MRRYWLAFFGESIGTIGGTGTFIWIYPTRELVAIYLTNYGQPVPFGAENWSKLILEVGSKDFFDLVVRLGD